MYLCNTTRTETTALVMTFYGGLQFFIVCLVSLFQFCPPFHKVAARGHKKKSFTAVPGCFFLSRLRHHPSRKYDFLHLKCLFAKVTTSYRCAHCRTYLKRCYFHCYQRYLQFLKAGPKKRLSSLRRRPDLPIH